MAVLLALGRVRPTRRDITLAGALVLGAASLCATRYALFGAFLPNTFHAKPPVVRAGLHYVLEVVASPWAASALALGLLGALVGRREHRAALAGALAWLLAPVVAGGDWMPVGRFLLPALGLACVASAGVSWVGSGRGARNAASVAVAASALLVAFAAANTLALRTLGALARSDMESIVHEQRVLGRWLVAAGVDSVALVDIGELGFRTPLRIVDLAGLTDPEIAGAPGTHLNKAGVADLVLDQRRPDALVVRVQGITPRDDGRLLREVPRHGIERVERDLARRVEHERSYRQVIALFPADMRTPFYGRVVYLRADLQLPAAVAMDRVLQYVEPLRM